MRMFVKLLLLVCIGGSLMGCGVRYADSDSGDMESLHAPSVPNKTDYVKDSVAVDYRTGMWMYRQSLIAYVGKVTEYINYIAIMEGFNDEYGRPCTFPFSWEPIAMPDTPAPVTTDPVLVSNILVSYVRELRKLIRNTNERYSTCVK